MEHLEHKTDCDRKMRPMKYLHWPSWFIICKGMGGDPVKEREKEKKLLGSAVKFCGIVHNHCLPINSFIEKAIPFEIAKIS